MSWLTFTIHLRVHLSIWCLCLRVLTDEVKVCRASPNDAKGPGD